VEDASWVQIDKSLKNLIEKTLHLLGRHLSCPRFEILLKVKLEIFKDQVERFLAVKYFFQPISYTITICEN
jgi:hypothetical protein